MTAKKQRECGVLGEQSDLYHSAKLYNKLNEIIILLKEIKECLRQEGEEGKNR